MHTNWPYRSQWKLNQITQQRYFYSTKHATSPAQVAVDSPKGYKIGQSKRNSKWQRTTISEEGVETSECARKETILRKASDQIPQDSHNSLLLFFSAAQARHIPAENKGTFDCIIQNWAFSTVFFRDLPWRGLVSASPIPGTLCSSCVVWKNR